MNDRKLLLIAYISYLFVFLLIFICGISGVFALSYDSFDVTWYYRDMANESNLLNVVKDEETPFYKATDEYVNGFTTRIEQPFSKDIQYIINYKLDIYYDISQDQFFRNDTIDRIIQYSWVDSDFKLLNTTAKQTQYECLSASICTRTISITQQVLALNNTSAIRFGVYTTENKSIGFYNSTQQIDYIMINNITIDENANSTIVDQNNQIIQGQDKLNQSIIDGNKETQEVIKDQFNSCRDSYNLLKLTDGTYSSSGLTAVVSNGVITINGTSTAISFLNIPIKEININEIFSVSLNNTSMGDNSSEVRFQLSGSNYINIPLNIQNNKVQNIQKFGTYTGFLVRISSGITINNGIIKPMINEGSTAKEYESYGEEICTNKIDDTNNKLEDIQGSINDSNIDGSLNNAGSFFENFSTTDHGGLSGIITAPLVAINQMLNKSCSPMTTNFKGKEISLPCGYDFWAKMGAIQDFLNLVLGGLLCYRIIVKLYKLIEKIKNPEDDRVEVMKL